MHREARRFGFNLGLGFNIIGCVLFYRHKEYFIWLSSLGSIMLITGILYPFMLLPVKKVLDKLMYIIGRFAGIISLLVFFYIVFAPVAIIIRLLGKDLIDKKIDKRTSSYWIRRRKTVFSKNSYEQMG